MSHQNAKNTTQNPKELENGMVRGLQNRHVQLIAIAGTIGTGLFLGAGRSISLTGPSIIIVYLLTGLFMFWMMRAMGEMLYHDPDQHTFINFITKYIGKEWGYFAGWSYWVSVIFLGMAEITAIAKFVFLLILGSVNLIAVRVFGEAEFWFAMIKIIAILALIATAIFMLLTGFKTSQGPVSFANISKGFEMFPNGWMKFLMSFQMVFFAYQAIEFVGITVSETQNPRKVLPKAIQEIPMRIVIFYVGALIAIMTIFPWRALPSDTSPFVMVFKLAGIKWAAALINFVVLTSAASALNSTLYSTGRHLYQLANEAPNQFMKRFKIGTLSKTGVPSKAIIFSAIVIAISAFINVLPGIKDAFALITASSSGVYIAIYVLTMLAHLKYRKSNDFMADGYLMPHYKILNPITIIFMVFVFITLFLQDSTYIGAIGATIWIAAFSFYSKFKFKKQ